MPGMHWFKNATTPLALIAALVALVGVLGACATDASAPGVATATPAAQTPEIDDVDRYFPNRLLGHKVGRLLSGHRNEVVAKAGESGLGDWLVAYTGASVGRKDTPYAFVSAAQGRSDDPALTLDSVQFATGAGRITETAPRDIDGQTVRTGSVETPAGTFDYALWQATPELAITVATGITGERLGLDPVSAMQELIGHAAA